MKLLQIVLLSVFSILVLSYSSPSAFAHDNSGCGGSYPYACHDGSLHLCSTNPPAANGTCTNGIITTQAAPGCRQKGIDMFGSTSSYVCDAYCGTLSPQTCPSGRTGRVIGDEGRDICVTYCASHCESGSDTTGLTCTNGGAAFWRHCYGGTPPERNVWCSTPTPTPNYPPPPPVTVYARPDTNCGGSIQVYWTATATSPNNNPPSNGYWLYRGTSSGFTPSQSNLIQGNIMTNPTSSNPYYDWNEGGTDMNIGTTYYYKVIASDNATGNSTSMAASSKGSTACGAGTPTNTPRPASPTPTTANQCTGNGRPVGCVCGSNNHCSSGNCDNGTCQPAQPTSAPDNYQILVTVFNDANSNGIQNANETLSTETVSMTVRNVSGSSCTGTGSTIQFQGTGRLLAYSNNSSRCITLNSVSGRTITTQNPQIASPSLNITKVSFGLSGGGSAATPTNTPPPATATPIGSCSGSACGRVTHCSTGAGLSGARVGVRRTGSSSTYMFTTNSSGYYTGSTNPNPGPVDIEVYLSGSSYTFNGWTSTSPSSGIYTNIARGSTRNFVICPPSGPTATPTNTPVPPSSDVSVQVRKRNTNGTTTALSGATATLYEQSFTGALVNRGNVTTNSLGVGTWNGLTGGTYGYRITLTNNGTGRSTWTIVSPASGLNYYSNVPLGSSRTFLLQEPTAATATPTNPPGIPYTLTGIIFNDHNNDGTCEAGSPQLPGTSITLNTNTGILLNSTTGSTYNFSGNTPTNQTILTVLNNTAPGYTMKGVRTSASGAFTPHTSSSYPVNFGTTPNQVVHFCMGAITIEDNPWFMTSIGSVRQQRISNPVPDGQSPTTGTTDASVFYSTAGIAFLGEATGTKWKVDEEYDEVPAYNKPGNASYSFYMNRAATTGTEIFTINSPYTNLNTLTENRVYRAEGDLVINGNSSINGPKRLVILADGDIRINGNITVNHPNSLIILAAKKDIVISQTVGGAPNATAFNIQAILTAENDIIVESNPASCPTSDLRLNVEGSLVANSDNPFGREINGGILRNQRNLCTNNANYPSLFVKSRLSFITELSDFYKVSSRFWNEVAP